MKDDECKKIIEADECKKIIEADIRERKILKMLIISTFIVISLIIVGCVINIK